jgi:crotonobetainyl-CoA:carnitine CoA-transferase CaiB-like acyl-CoA transferase
VLDTAELFSDPHLAARGFIQRLQHEQAGDVQVMRNPIRMSECDVPMRAAPVLGAHTDDVLAADLGLSPEKLAVLRDAHIIG